MNSIIKKVIEKKVIVIFLSIVIGIVGAVSYYILPRQESPDVSAPYALIVTPYPGASPNDVKELVTKKIEDKMVELDGFDKVEGTSKEGLSIVLVAFDSDVDNDKAMQDVRNAVADVESELPSGTMASDINTDLTEAAGIIISLSGDNYTYDQLESFGELFEDKLSDVDGISKFTIEGKLEKEVKVVVDIEKLNQYGMGIDDIDKALQAQNVEIPSGDIEYGKDKITVKTPGIFTSLKDVENTIIGISSQNGSTVRLRDVADIYMGLEEGAQKYKQNGKNAVLLTGYFKEGKNVVIIGKDVRKIIDEVKAQLPEDLVVEEVIYQPEDVSKSVNDFMINLVEGVVLVIVVVFLGMGMRNALVVSAAIPMSILITFGVMYLMGIKIHQMSLTALIVALGILVDNAIVISDTIQVRIDNGETPDEAAQKGTSMSAIPIFTATLTTIAAFSPLLGLPGVAGDFLVAIPLVLIISIIAAYVVSMFITPAMSAMLFKKTVKKNGKENVLRKFFKNTLRNSLNKSKTVVISTFIILILVVKILMPALPSEFFPYTDKTLLYIDMNSEAASNIDATEELTDEVVDLLKDVPEITSYTVAVGNGLPKFYISMPPAMPSNDYGQMVCKFDLEKGDSRFNSNLELADFIQVLLDENISAGECKVKLLANASPSDAKVEIKVSGDDLDRLAEVSNMLKKEISHMEGVANVKHNMKDKTYEINVDVNEDKAISMGITKYDIQRQINMALYGKKSSVYRKNGNEYNIKLESNINN
ncbi:efflux RND transporter permease subunit, partial [Anaeromicrobium sediminis]